MSTQLNSLLRKSMLVIVLVFTAVNAVQASQQALQAELDGYIKTFSGNNFPEQRKAIEPLGWSGYQSPALYDVIAEKLTGLKNASSKVEKERASWFAKALALSGNQKYRSVLQDVADNASAKKVRKHAKTALERLPKYAAWNPIIAQGLATTRLPLAEQRIRNMLAAQDITLYRLGVKRVYYTSPSNTELVAIAKARLMKNYQAANDKDSIDAMAWAIRLLAESGDSSHVPALEEIAANAKEKKLRKFAKKYRGYF